MCLFFENLLYTMFVPGLLEGSGFRENLNYIEESINKQVTKDCFI